MQSNKHEEDVVMEVGGSTNSEQELRAKINDDRFIEEQLSLLSPGIANSEKRFKVHQFTHTAMMLPDFNDYQRIKPLIDALLNELDLSDFLGCSAALEILAELCASRQQNIRYFEQNGLLGKIYDLFRFTKENPDLGIIHIACIRFFGYLTTADPHALVKYPLFTGDVFDAVNRFNSFDLNRRKLAFETLAVITTSSAAKQFLASDECPYDMRKAMNHLGAAVATGAEMPELKASYLNAIRTIFDSFDPKNAVESDPILRSWFDYLGAPMARLLFICLKTPFAEVQLASLQALLALMRHHWAPAQFCALDGFVNFLVNREPHFSHQGLQLKYDLVCRLIDSQCAAIDEQSMQQLADYRARGPFAPPEKLEIATEESG